MPDGRHPDSRHLAASLGLPTHEALRLMAAVTGRSLGEVRAGIELSKVEAEELQRLAARRRAGEPLQYLEGTAPFGPIEVEVDRRVLVPRPETEQLYELAVGGLAGDETVVDIGTGSGALALALKATVPGLRVVATDVAAGALEVAAANARRLGLEVEFRRGSDYQALDPDLRGRIDVIVSNPPYVAESDYARLPVDVRHEPREALVAGPDGLDIIRSLLAGAPAWMSPRGRLFFEIGEQHAEVVSELLPEGLLGRVEADLSGRPRFLLARRVGTVPEAVAALHQGEVVGLPTDTVYGLAVSATDPEAVERLYRLKGRPSDKPIPVLVASLEQAESIGDLDRHARDLASRYWPGALTLVVPMRAVLAPGVGDHQAKTVGIRMPDHPLALAVLAEAGPLAVTSANPSGSPPAADAVSAWATLGEGVAVYLPGEAGGGVASTVVDLTGPTPRVLRPGPLGIDLTST